MSRDGLHRGIALQLASLSPLVLLPLLARVPSPRAWLVVFLLVAAISSALWRYNYRRARAIADTPTSRIGSAAQGYVELIGEARTIGDTALASPLSASPCVWFRYKLEQRANDKWRVEQEGCSDASFLLDDGSGIILIDVEGAEVVTDHKRCWVDGDRRYTEWLLIPQARLYALGELTTVVAQSDDAAARIDVGALLAEWKNDKDALHARFDLNGNGEIDEREWELARGAAQREVRAQHAALRRQPGTGVLRKPRGGAAFLLSNFDSRGLAQRYRRWSRLHGTIAAGALVAALVIAFR
ncbi:MAG TPA: hypothetical protein VFB54_05980 [Burkholderiales bacterium]|nr:hypothetical protein [Burkholderiales bacterium]